MCCLRHAGVRARDSLVFGVSCAVCRACGREETGIAVGETSEQGFVIQLLEGQTDELQAGQSRGRINAGCLHFEDLPSHVKDLE